MSGLPKYAPSVYVDLKSKNLNNVEIAERLGVDESSVRRGLRKAKLLKPLPETEDSDDFLDTPIRHTGAIAISADWHIPLVDWGFANRFLEHCAEEDIRTLAIAGDFFNHDALSAYDYKQESADLGTELREATHIMRALVEQFDKIIFVWGNHDARFHKALNYKISFKHAMRLCFGDLGEEALSKIEFSNLDHFWVNDSWYVAHPKNYTSTPLTTARKIAAKTHSNVITAHSHHAALGYDVSGQFVCAEAGGLFDATKTAYLQRTTTFPQWQQGYAFITDDNRIEMHTPRWSMKA